MRYVLTLMMLLCAAGCLSKAERDARNDSAAPAVTADDYTGAVVYGRRGCTPCRALHDDIVRHCEDHDWTHDSGDDYSADWLFRSDSNGTVPAVDFYRNGKLIDSVEGYSQSRYWFVRKPLLQDILDKHPRR